MLPALFPKSTSSKKAKKLSYLTRSLPRTLPVGRIPLIFGGLGTQRVKIRLISLNRDLLKKV